MDDENNPKTEENHVENEAVESPKTLPESIPTPEPEPTPIIPDPTENIPEPIDPADTQDSSKIKTESAETVPTSNKETPSTQETPDSVPLPQKITSTESQTETAQPETTQTSAPTEPIKTVEKHGRDVTITEVMQPETPVYTEADLEKQRKENLKLANEKRQSKKREKIEKILSLFSEKSEVANDEVEKLLHISDATATRYLDTLEKEGRIRQVGKTGRGVVYEKI